MNLNTLNNASFFNTIRNFMNKNLKLIIIFLIICFVIFITYQIFNYYTKNKILKNSISFYNTLNLNDINSINEPFSNLSKQKNFYAILSKLELIDISLNNKDYEYAIFLYNELLKDKKLNKIYISAIASKASYKFIDISFSESSQDYLINIENFISFIDNELINYQGIKLELNYLVKILEAQKNNKEYNKFNEAIDVYNNIVNSDVVSSVIKERVNKIHEFHLYK